MPDPRVHKDRLLLTGDCYHDETRALPIRFSLGLHRRVSQPKGVTDSINQKVLRHSYGKRWHRTISTDSAKNRELRAQ